VIDCPVGEHSSKPAETRDRIVELMGDVPRIELFARGTVPGWHSLGNAINGMDLSESIPLVASGKLDLNEQKPVGGPPEGDVLSQFLI
jgi:N6-adenosine-specific RNA methylase IME4